MTWIQTYTGIAFDPLSPAPEDIDPRDIGHALANICRFTGHTSRFYSVAEHSVRVMRAVRQRWHLASPHALLPALLHDASEAYLCDMARPVKHATEMQHYREVEAGLQQAIGRRFSLWFEPSADFIVRADNTLLATEKRYLMGPEPQSWGPLPEPLTLPWWDRMGWSPRKAERVFLRELGALLDALAMGAR